jgi:hypothetical protein
VGEGQGVGRRRSAGEFDSEPRRYTSPRNTMPLQIGAAQA